MKRKLTKREGTLLLIFSILLIGYGYYQIIIVPQNQILETFYQDRIYYEKESNSKNQYLEMENEVNNKIDLMKQEILTMKKSFFSELKQEDIIILFHQLAEEAGLQISSLSFVEPRVEEIGEISLVVYSISFPFEGRYISLVDLLESLQKYEKKVIVNDLRISSQEKDIIVGNMVVDFYSLPLMDENKDLEIHKTKENNNNKRDPFSPFEGYEKIVEEEVGADEKEESKLYDWGDVSNIRITFGSGKSLLEGFENDNAYFMPSHFLGNGNISHTDNKKEGNHSLRLEYAFPISDDPQYAYVMLEEQEIYIEAPPEKIGLWVYAYEKSSHSIAGSVMDQRGGQYQITFAKQINWIGWRRLEINPNWKASQYPLQIEKLYVTVDPNEQGKGTILLDGLEVSYPVDTLDEPNIQTERDYIHYEVQPGDTLMEISKKFYNSPEYVSVIMEYNYLQASDYIESGQYIVLPQNPESN